MERLVNLVRLISFTITLNVTGEYQKMAEQNKLFKYVLKPLAWFPVVIINAILVWSYFAYVVILCIDTIESNVEKAVFLVFFHPLFFLLMVAYWKTIMSCPGFVPAQFYLSKPDIDQYEREGSPQDYINQLSHGLPIVTTSVNGGTRYCEQCKAIKPDRAHHCSMCNRCVLKMDHHCPWVNNCVGFSNYKFFLLFLFYGILYALYVACTSFQYFLKFWTGHQMKADSSLHILFLFFISAMFFISLWSLFGYHIFLTLKNRTTLESFRGPIFASGADKNGFNLGKGNNTKQVFGNQCLLWMIPVFSSLGNGASFPVGGSQNPESQGLLRSADEHIVLVEGEETELYAHRLNGHLPAGNSERALINSDSDVLQSEDENGAEIFGSDLHNPDLHFDHLTVGANGTRKHQSSYNNL